MADRSVKLAEQEWVPRNQQREGAVRFEQVVDSLQRGDVILDVLEDIDAQRRIKAVATERLSGSGHIVLQDDHIGIPPETRSRQADKVLVDVDADHQLPVRQKTGDRAGPAPDFEDPLAQGSPNPVKDPPVVSPCAIHGPKRLRTGRVGREEVFGLRLYHRSCNSGTHGLLSPPSGFPVLNGGRPCTIPI